MSHVNSNQKRVEVAIHISDKIDFQSKLVTRDTEGHPIVINESIPEKDMKITNI